MLTDGKDKPDECPRCGSPDPARHPAVSGGGEVTHLCPDEWHGEIPDRVRAIFERPLAAPVGAARLGLVGGWMHADGTPCPEYLASVEDVPENGWWCTAHQMHVRMPDKRNPLPGALEEIKAGIEAALDHRTGPNVMLMHRIAADSSRLLAAVDAVLKPHDVRPWYLGATDCEHPEPADDADEWADWNDDHPPGAGDVGRICLLTQLSSYCTECTRLVYGDEDPVGEDYVAAPCSVRQAITRALTGEAAGEH